MEGKESTYSQWEEIKNDSLLTMVTKVDILLHVSNKKWL